MGEFPVLREEHARADKSPDDKDAHLNGAPAVQDTGRHDRSVFGEDKRKMFPMTSPACLV